MKHHVESLASAMDPVEALVAALRARDVAAVSRLLDEHEELRARINEPLPPLPFGSMLLHAAVNHGSRELTDVLLRAGADINVKSHWWAGGFTVLDGADASLVPFLLERGARMTINAAAQLGRRDDVERLLRDDPTLVNARGGDGQTPLHVAATVEIAALLLDAGADLDALDVDHESTPAQYAVRERQDVTRHLMARGCRTDLLMAAAVGDLALVRRHLDADPGAIRTAVDERYFPMRNLHAGGSIYIWTLGSNKTAHIVARDFGHEDVFDFLMRASPPSLQLSVASRLRDGDRVARLLEHEPALVGVLSDEERRALVDAAQDNDADVVQFMLDAGWPVDARNQGGATALHWAAFHGNADMARALLRHRATLDVEDRQFHSTPLGWALHGSVHGWHPERGDYPGVVSAMLDSGATLPSRGAEGASEPVRALLAERGHGS